MHGSLNPLSNSTPFSKERKERERDYKPRCGCSGTKARSSSTTPGLTGNVTCSQSEMTSSPATAPSTPPRSPANDKAEVAANTALLPTTPSASTTSRLWSSSSADTTTEFLEFVAAAGIAFTLRGSTTRRPVKVEMEQESEGEDRADWIVWVEEGLRSGNVACIPRTAIATARAGEVPGEQRLAECDENWVRGGDESGDESGFGATRGEWLWRIASHAALRRGGGASFFAGVGVRRLIRL